MSNIRVYEQVAILHFRNIENGFLRKLGVPFLTLLYQAIDNSESGILFVETENDTVIGFVAATSNMRDIYRYLLRNLYSLAISLVPSIFKFRILKGVYDIFRYSQHKEKQKMSEKFELLSIAVHKDYRNQGVASKLYFKLVDFFTEQKVKRFQIAVGQKLDNAHLFYKRVGAVPRGARVIHPGETSVIYVHEIE